MSFNQSVKEAALEALKEAQKSGDIEAAHARADDILCEFLRLMGHEDLVTEWAKVDKWYA